MDEKYFEQAQRTEERTREAGVASAVAKAHEHFEPVYSDGVACCHDCGEPLAEHRFEYGICVPCKGLREQQETRYRR